MAGLSELAWRRYRRVFRKQRRATKGAVASSVVVAELAGAVMWMGLELGRGRRAHEAATTKKVAVGEAAAAANKAAAAAANKAVAAANKAAAATNVQGSSNNSRQGGSSRGKKVWWVCLIWAV